MTAPTALDTWRKRAVEEVTLPSMMQAQIRKPRSDELLRGGHLPADLRQAVMKVYAGSAKVEDLDEETMGGFLEQQERLVATMVVGLRAGNDDEWEPVELTVEDLGPPNGLPPDDVEALRDIANRTKTVQAVTARSLMGAELLERAAGLRREEEAKPGSIPGWKDFRDERRGPEPGADGGRVEGEAEQPAAPGRARRRSRAGG